MGRTATPTFRIETELASPRWAATPGAWNTRQNGRPTAANLAAYMTAQNASIAPGGANEHLGEEHKATAARVIRQETGDVVATWSLEADAKVA